VRKRCGKKCLTKFTYIQFQIEKLWISEKLSCMCKGIHWKEIEKMEKCMGLFKLFILFVIFFFHFSNILSKTDMEQMAANMLEIV
jgi:hypothetical protein